MYISPYIIHLCVQIMKKNKEWEKYHNYECNFNLWVGKQAIIPFSIFSAFSNFSPQSLIHVKGKNT